LDRERRRIILVAWLACMRDAGIDDHPLSAFPLQSSSLSVLATCRSRELLITANGDVSLPTTLKTKGVGSTKYLVLYCQVNFLIRITKFVLSLVFICLFSYEIP